MIRVKCQTELFQMVRTLHSPGRFAGRLHGRQQKGDQNPDDRNNDQKFNEGERKQITPPLNLTRDVFI